jgi:hypothetical protein
MIVVQETGTILAWQVEVAKTVWRRGLGLMGRREMKPGSALILDPCNAIHTMFMRFPIDVLFCSKDGTILRCAAKVVPWRIGPVCLAARYTVELPAGTIQANGIREGHKIQVKLPN